MSTKSKFLCSKESIEYCEKSIPGLTDILSEKLEYLDNSTQKTHNEWRQKRIAYMRAKIRLDTLKSIIEESQFSKDVHCLSIKDQQTLTEITQNLRISNDQHFQRTVPPHAPNIIITEKLSQLVKTEMKKKLLETLCDLHLHYMPHGITEITKPNIAGAYKSANDLVDLIKNDLNCLERMREHKNSKYNDDMNINIEKKKKQRLEEHYNALEQIVNIHLTNRIPNERHQQADHLAAKVIYIIFMGRIRQRWQDKALLYYRGIITYCIYCLLLQAKTLEMKMKSLEEEERCKTYTKEACNELEKVRRKMLDKLDAVRSEV